VLVRPLRVDEPVGGVGTQHPCLRESAHTRTRRGPMWLLSLSLSTSSLKICGTSAEAGPASAGTAADVDGMGGDWRTCTKPAYSRGKREGALGAARFKHGARRQSVTSGCVPRRQLNACLVGEPCATHTYTRRHTTRASESRHAVLTNDAAALRTSVTGEARRCEGRRPKAEGRRPKAEGRRPKAEGRRRHAGRDRLSYRKFLATEYHCR